MSENSAGRFSAEFGFLPPKLTRRVIGGKTAAPRRIMSFELGRTLNNGAGWLCDSPLIYNTLGNPVVAALLITALALVIMHSMHRSELRDVGWRRRVKTGFWLMIGTSALIFVHYYALNARLRKNSLRENVRDVMASINYSAATGKGYAVNPMGGPDDEFNAEGGDEDGENAGEDADAPGDSLDIRPVKLSLIESHSAPRPARER